jgi:uncharacterized membrane protein
MIDDFFALSQADRYPYVVLMGAIVGLIFGIWLSQESNRRMPVRGGVMAQFFHYLAASTVATILPMVIIGLLSGLQLLQLISMGLLFSLGTAIFLFAYAFFEGQVQYEEVKPARELD